jgi:hypothetical protein
MSHTKVRLLFEKIMWLTFWSPRNDKRYLFDGKRSGLNKFAMNTRISESGHVFAFVIITVLLLYFALVAKIHLAIIATFIM